MVIEFLRTWYKNAQKPSKSSRQVVLTPINWDLSGTYQYWATKISLNLVSVLTVKSKLPLSMPLVLVKLFSSFVYAATLKCRKIG